MRKVVAVTAIAAVCMSAHHAQAGKVIIMGGMQSGPQLALAAPSSLDGIDVPTARQTIAFQSNLTPGSILIRTRERKLYFILADSQAIMYPVGVGREGFAWSGRNRISRKAVWPDWRPPKIMIEREAKRNHFIPAFMEGGPSNPLGARALYIGDTEFRIHGTTQPWSIGRAVSSGCIRMLNEEVIDLYARVEIGAEVVVE
jgi:lipoprotein-anchoring transpeptidase ErfK/SrfK